jgi:hypothetical protein
MNDMEWSGAAGPGEGAKAFGMAGSDGNGAEGRAGDDPVAVAEWLFWDYVRDLRSLQAELAARASGEIDPARLKKAVETAQTLRNAVHLLMTERSKLDKFRKEIARDEIGRRLACLRRAERG